MVGGEEHDDFESRTGCVEQLHGRRSPADKETWWWNVKVQDVIKDKKGSRKMWETSGWQEGRYSYRQANKAAKKAVAQQGAGNECVGRGAGNTGG